jgi:DNA invertase Pin-like site-specific DNA recombinase
MLGSFAEFERTIIRERTRVGLEQARIRGHVPGRKPTLSPDQRTGIVEAVTSVRGTAADVARLFNVRRASFCALSFRNEQSLSVGFREHSAMTPTCRNPSFVCGFEGDS